MAIASQSLLIQRSYSYIKPAAKVEFKESQSLLIQRSYSYRHVFIRLDDECSACRNPFLFRGPIPTAEFEGVSQAYDGRNPFLFRGPIPTIIALNRWLFQLGSRNPFLFRGPIPTNSVEGIARDWQSQSLLIQRSYSYFRFRLEVFRSRLRRNPFLFRGPIPT